MHEVLVNRLGGLSLPRKSVVRLTDRPDMTLDVYRGRKTTKQQATFTHRCPWKIAHSLTATIRECPCQVHGYLLYSKFFQQQTHFGRSFSSRAAIRSHKSCFPLKKDGGIPIHHLLIVYRWILPLLYVGGV